MDYDFCWLMYDIEKMLLEKEQLMLELEEIMTDYFSGSNRPALSLRSELTPHDEWLNRRMSRRRRRPKRQLHPSCLQMWHKWERRERSHNRAERLVLRDLVNARDAEDQLDDYFSDTVTSLPSVGMTIGNAYFRDNIGEYPRTYSDIADVIYEVDVEDETPDNYPDWQFHGFDSPEEYEEYLSSYAAMYEADWHDLTLNRRASSEFETA